jgi:hypothetical protein
MDQNEGSRYCRYIYIYIYIFFFWGGALLEDRYIGGYMGAYLSCDEPAVILVDVIKNLLVLKRLARELYQLYIIKIIYYAIMNGDSSSHDQCERTTDLASNPQV